MFRQRPCWLLKLPFLLSPVSYGSFQDIDVYILQGSEPDAIPGYACLAQFLAERPGQVRFVRDTGDIHGDPGFVGADTDPESLSSFTISILYRAGTVSYGRVGNGFIFAVPADEESFYLLAIPDV